MRALRILFTSLLAAAAVVAGLFVTAVVALTALFAFAASRLLGRARRAPPHAPAPVRPRVAMGEAIDVTATEVPADPPPR